MANNVFYFYALGMVPVICTFW